MSSYSKNMHICIQENYCREKKREFETDNEKKRGNSAFKKRKIFKNWKEKKKKKEEKEKKRQFIHMQTMHFT